MSYEAIQQSIRGQTGTSLTYEEDWIALWNTAGTPAGAFNERMLAWINGRLGASYQDINDAMQAFAESEGYASFGEIQAIIFNVAPALSEFIVTPSGAWALSGSDWLYTDTVGGLSRPGITWDADAFAGQTFDFEIVIAAITGAPSLRVDGFTVDAVINTIGLNTFTRTFTAGAPNLRIRLEDVSSTIGDSFKITSLSMVPA